MFLRIYLILLRYGFHTRVTFVRTRSAARETAADLPEKLWRLGTRFANQRLTSRSSVITPLLSLQSVAGLNLGIGWRKAIWSAAIFHMNRPASFQALFFSAVAVLMLTAHFVFGLGALLWWIACFTLIPLGLWILILLKRWEARPADTIHRSRVRPRGAARYLAAAAFVTPFIGAVYFLNSYDISFEAYFIGGNSVIFSNLFKTILCFYLFVLFHSAGFLLVSVPYLSKISDHLTPLERFLLNSFIGMGLLSVLMFVAATVGALSLPLALAVSAPLVLAGYSQFAGLVQKLSSAVRERIRVGAQGIRRGIVAAEAISLFLLVLYVLLTRGLFPGDLSYDEVAHYQPYIKTVIENGGIRFNDYWYHFYISKGAGLFFLGALLGDVHTPLIVSFVAFTLTGLCLGYLVRRATGSIEWALLAVIIYFVAAPVPGYEVFLRMSVMSGGLIAGVVLSILLLRDIPKEQKIRWAIACLPVFIGLMALTPTSAAFLTPLLAIYFIAAVMRGRLLNALDYLIWGVTAVASVIAILSFNFAVTGLAEGSPLRTFFSFADQGRLNELVSSYLVVFIEEASSRNLGRLDLLGLLSPDLGKIAFILQTHRYSFLFAIGSMFWVMVLWVGGALMVGRRSGNASFDCLWPGLIFVGLAVVMSHVNQQDHSVLRFLFGAKIFFIAFAVVLWKVSIELLPRFRLRRALELTVVAVFAAWAINIMMSQTSYHQRYPYYFKYLTGQIGVLGSYKAMTGHGGIWPVCLEARDIAGPDDKLLHMNVAVESGACHVMPGMAFRLEFGNGFGGLWHNMVFSEEPDESKRWFRKAGINYFLFDSNQPLFGCAAYSAPFRPENIGRYLTIVHATHENHSRDGYILAWRVPGDPPIPQAFIAEWQKHLARDRPWEMGQMCRRVGGYYRKFGLREPVHQDLSLPPLRSWQ